MAENPGMTTGLTTTIERDELWIRLDALVGSLNRIRDDVVLLRIFVQETWDSGDQVPVGVWLNSAEIRSRGVKQAVDRLKFEFTGEVSDE